MQNICGINLTMVMQAKKNRITEKQKILQGKLEINKVALEIRKFNIKTIRKQ